MASLKIIREVFGLSLIEAKEVWVQADKLAPSLWQFQEQLFNDLQQALDEGEHQSG